jgi:3'(2'), 5'-bisphosphate nucleotidase
VRHPPVRYGIGMTTTLRDLRTVLPFAVRIAEATGQRLLRLRASGRWTEPALIGDVGDQAADAYLQGALREARPDDGLLSEETADDGARLSRAVHVGLAVDGAPVLGVVALPSLGRTLAAICAGDGAELVVHGREGDWSTAAVLGDTPSPARPRLVTSRSHTPPWVERVAAELGGELVPCGSVGCKVAMLLSGRGDVYVHDKGLKERDTCAPEVVARAAGWSVTRLDGTPHRYNQRDPRNDQFAVCRPAAATGVIAAVARARAD